MPHRKEAIFPFSADPITLGHIEIIKRASRIFDRLHLVVLNNPSKHYTFLQEERVAQVRALFKDKKDILVKSHEGLLVDYAYSQGVDTIVRGLRDERDIGFEAELAFGNHRQFMRKKGPFELETLYLLSSQEHRNISSGFAKSVVMDHGAVEAYVPLMIKRALEEKLLKQYRLSITGSIACGKTTVAKKLLEIFHHEGIKTHYVDLDLVVRDIYAFSDHPMHPQLKAAMIKRFGKEILTDKGNLDQKKLSEWAYADSSGQVFSFLNENLGQALVYEVRNRLKDKQGLILIDGVRILESDFSVVANHQSILVHCPEDVQLKRLMKRDHLSKAEATTKIAHAGNRATKEDAFHRLKKRWHYGSLMPFDNTDHQTQASQLKKLSESIYREFEPIKDFPKAKR